MFDGFVFRRIEEAERFQRTQGGRPAIADPEEYVNVHFNKYPCA